MKKYSFLLFIMAFFFIGCDTKIDHNPQKIHWDRDMCERCKMVLSDRKFSAQVVNPENGRKYTFDDIGCVVLWFRDDKIAWSDKAIIWVNDVHTGEWIDARSAWYDVENITPMAYGFGAHKSKEALHAEDEVVDFAEMSRRIIKIGK
ncbi:MAG: nitrous oxide reductase accessory protein NosL [Sulfurospirillaceae bacterium]|nr:nitrous oxide reductase accessory protein NosL [Sulfurospirillaceae bacterium]MDD2827152.1 nitrous oxide reductase accessory protein NosL [Sulfurospirillaceae bacterium]